MRNPYLTMPLHTFESVSAVVPGSKVLYLNASLLKISNCDWHAYLTSVCGLELRVPAEIPQTGTALHKFCSQLDIGLDPGTALADAFKIAPANPKIRQTLVALTGSRPALPPPILTKSGEPFVEQRLEVPWRHYFYNGQSYTIVLLGTMDRVVCVNDVLIIQDYKTALYYKAEDALRKYEYEIQFEFYKWLLYEFGHLWLDQTHANLARNLRLLSQVIIAQCGGKVGWVQGPKVGFTTAKATLMVELLDVFIERVLLPIQSSPYITQNGMLVNACQHCDFNTLCHATDDATRELIRNTKFKTRNYGEKKEE